MVKYKEQHAIYVQNRSSGFRAMENAKSPLEQARALLAHSHESTPIPITPRQFCRLMFGMAEMSSEELIATETEQGHKKRCVALNA